MAPIGAIARILFGFLPVLGGVNLAMVALIGLVALLAYAWSQNWGNIQQIMSGVGTELMNTLGAIGEAFYGLTQLILGWATGNEELVGAGARAIGIAFMQVFYELPVEIARALGNTGTAILSWFASTFARLDQNMAVWGNNMIVSLANGMIAAGRYLFSVLTGIAEGIARYFRSYSPPRYGPLRGIQTWGTNLINTLIAGMQAADFDAITEVADRIGEAIKGNIEEGLVAPTLYAQTVGQANNLVDDMLAIVRGGGRVNDDFFSSLREGLGEWYEYIVQISLAYQNVYANERSLRIEKEKLETLRRQREQLEAQNKLRITAFDELLGGTDGAGYAQNTENIIDPTSPEGQAKIAQMRQKLTREDFQNWLQFQKRLWEQRSELEANNIRQQETALQQSIDAAQAQLDAAQKQYDLYVKIYEYARQMYELAAEQDQLLEGGTRGGGGGGGGTYGSPEQLAAYLAEIARIIGQDQLIRDENTLRSQSPDDIVAYGEATRQRERETQRLAALEQLNRRRRAEFEAQLINASSDAERQRIKEQKDAWDAAYREERARLQERRDFASQILEASEQLADASAISRVAPQEAAFQQEIANILGDQTATIRDANTLREQAGSLDRAAMSSREQLREEERRLRDLQAAGDQRRLDFEQRILEAQGDPEKLRRIQEEQKAWDLAYKRALEAQQLRVELARRAQQDIGDEAGALGGGGFGRGVPIPELGGSESIFDAIKPGEALSIEEIRKLLGLSEEPLAELERIELPAIKTFDNVARALRYLSDESIPAEERMRNLGLAIGEFTGMVLAFTGLPSIWGAVMGEILRLSFELDRAVKEGLSYAWEQIADWTITEWNRLWNWTLPSSWVDFRNWVDSFLPGLFDGLQPDWENGIAGLYLSFNNWVLEMQQRWTGFWLDLGVQAYTKLTELQQGWTAFWINIGTEAGTRWVELQQGWTAFWVNIGTEAGTRWVELQQGWTDFWTNVGLEAGAKLLELQQSLSTWWTDTTATWSTNLTGLTSQITSFFTGENGLGAKFQSGLGDIVARAQEALYGKDGLIAKWEALKQRFVDPVVAVLNNVFSPIKGFVDSLAGIRFPSLPGWLRGEGGDIKTNGSFAGGLKRVPFDGFIAELHQGERVLTAAEARMYNALESALGGASSLLARTGVAIGGSVYNQAAGKQVTINVGNIDATNPEEGKAFLAKIAFLT